MVGNEWDDVARSVCERKEMKEMKNLFRMFFCSAVLLIGVAFGSAASAHTMPDSEAALIYPRAQGDMDVRVEFGCGMRLQKAEDVLGSDFEKEEKEIGSLRIVSCKYADITFGAVAQSSDERPSGEFPVVFVECRSPWFHTPSGFRVGDSYEDVRQMYGEGDVSYGDSLKHTYWFDEAKSMSFVVDGDGVIEEIDLNVVVFG